MSNKETVRRIAGTGWCGMWADGNLGFLLSKYVSQYPQTLNTEQLASLNDSGMYGASDFCRVRIIIEPVRDKRGKLIVRRKKVRS